MSTITREVLIDASPQKVWAALADFGNIYLFNPNVPQSYLTSEQTAGVGTTRHCDFNMMGASVEERIVEWQENKSMKVDIYAWKNLPGIKKMTAALKLDEVNGRTRLQGTMEYTLKYGPLGKIMDASMMKPRNTKAWEGLLAGIKRHLETGEVINGLQQLNLDVVAVPA